MHYCKLSLFTQKSCHGDVIKFVACANSWARRAGGIDWVVINLPRQAWRSLCQGFTKLLNYGRSILQCPAVQCCKTERNLNIS